MERATERGESSPKWWSLVNHTCRRLLLTTMYVELMKKEQWMASVLSFFLPRVRWFYFQKMKQAVGRRSAWQSDAAASISHRILRMTSLDLDIQRRRRRRRLLRSKRDFYWNAVHGSAPCHISFNCQYMVPIQIGLQRLQCSTAAWWQHMSNCKEFVKQKMII